MHVSVCVSICRECFWKICINSNLALGKEAGDLGLREDFLCVYVQFFEYSLNFYALYLQNKKRELVKFLALLSYP